MYKLKSTSNTARRGEFVTPHGIIQTPAFMNVATCGAIKGGVSALDLKKIKCQVQLCNTYHLHLRPGDKTVKKLGGLHKFTRWEGPILTDSGGFQKESYWAGKRGILTMPQGWQEITDTGWHTLIGDPIQADWKSLISEIMKPFDYPANIFGDGHAADKIVKTMTDQLNQY